MLRESNIPFTLTCSNYTSRIESPVIDRKFVYSMQSNQCFAAYAKVKKDVKDKEVPSIDKRSLVYFEHDFREARDLRRVYNIDLKSAYASVLFKEGFITRDTFNYLGRLPKHDRLASVGMLASRKNTFGFNRQGEVLTYESTVSNLENFFFYAVQKTFEIMQNLKAILGRDYLFTWVDGIYFIPNMDSLVACEDYLRKIGYRYSEEVLYDWQVRLVKGAVRLTFLKDGKIKTFSLPPKQSVFSMIMADSMREVKKENKNLFNDHFKSNILSKYKKKSKWERLKA